MGTIFKIAFRNIMRHKRRTFLTAIIISLGLFVYIWMDSLITGINRNSIENMINLSESSIKVFSMDYDKDRNAYPLKYGITDFQKLETSLLKINGVTGVTPRISFLGELSSGVKAIHVIGNVVEPQKDKTVFTTAKFIQKGGYFSGHSESEILLGAKLAQDLNLGVGDIVTFRSMTRYEANNAVDFEVVGLINSSHPSVNEGGAYITFQAAEAFLDLGGLRTEADIHVNWKKGESVEKYLNKVQLVKDEIKKNFNGDIPYTFNELSGGFLALLKQKGTSGAIMSLLVLLIAAIGIVNSVLMSVYERIKEVGVLKAMGIKQGEIMRMFLYEGVLIGFIGSSIGIILAFLMNVMMVNNGIDMTRWMKGMSSTLMPVSAVFYGQWNPGTFIGMYLFGIIISLLAAYVPARKAALMHATECLHFV